MQRVACQVLLVICSRMQCSCTPLWRLGGDVKAAADALISQVAPTPRILEAEHRPRQLAELELPGIGTPPPSNPPPPAFALPTDAPPPAFAPLRGVPPPAFAPPTSQRPEPSHGAVARRMLPDEVAQAYGVDRHTARQMIDQVPTVFMPRPFTLRRMANDELFVHHRAAECSSLASPFSTAAV